MYPDNQLLEIFGEQVMYPGLDPATHKFTDGDFSNPLVKPSHIPAATFNLILDNLESIIEKCGGTPKATGAAQIAELVTPHALSKAIVMRDEHGRAKVAAPQAGDDIAHLAEIIAAVAELRLDMSSHADQIDGMGRNLLDVLGADSIPAAMAELRRRCSNNGEIDSAGIPDFRGLEISDYIDGLDLGGIATLPAGPPPKHGSTLIKTTASFFPASTLIKMPAIRKTQKTTCSLHSET
jgi:hypothetical protein